MRQGKACGVACGIVLWFGVVARVPGAPPAPQDATMRPYSSPIAVAVSPDGGRVAVADRTAGNVAVIDGAVGKVAARVPVAAPYDVTFAGDGSIFAADWASHAAVQIAGGKVVRRFETGYYPTGVAVAGGRGLLLVANSCSHDVSVIELARGREVRALPNPVCRSGVGLGWRSRIHKT